MFYLKTHCFSNLVGVNMKAILGKKYFDIKEANSEIEEPNDNEVLIKIKACGICGTDIHYLKDFEKDYAPLGHEIAGKVIETGRNVDNVIVGDNVVVEDVSYCGTCDECKNGQIRRCRNGYSLNGQSGMGEYISVNKNMVNVFNDIDFVDVCLTEPLAVALNAYEKISLPIYSSLVIFGLGPIALLNARLAKVFGAKQIIMVGSNPNTKKNEARVKAAQKMGADRVLFSSNKDLLAEIEEHTKGGADGVFITSPPSTMKMALKTLKFGANAVVASINLAGDSEVKIDINELIFNKNSVMSIFAEPAIGFPKSIQLIKDGVVDVKSIITDCFTIEEAKVKLKDLFEKDSYVIKAVMINN
jgi:L-iditol 2-dehydrogenase